MPIDPLKLYDQLSEAFEPKAAHTLAEVLKRSFEEVHNHYIRQDLHRFDRLLPA